jgi:hypothetical protein
MSLEVQQATFAYLSKLLEEEDEAFCKDLSDLVTALLEKENPQFKDIFDDMEPFLKENTNLFMSWLKKFVSPGMNLGNQDIIEEEQEERDEIVVEKIREPKKGKSKLVFDEVHSSHEQKTNRMKRFGLPDAEESEPNKTRKLDNALPSRSKPKPTNKTKEAKEIKEITIERPSATILTKKDNYVFKVVPESVKKIEHVVTKNNDQQFTVSFANNTAVAKLPQRCHFYPNCSKSDCPYLHPEIPCTTFPHCTYGVNCRYVHPVCRFADRCTKPGCPYTHSLNPFAQVDCKNGFVCSGRGVGGTCKYKHPLLACKFGITCLGKGTSCLFSHSTICNYGTSCKTPACKFAHIVKAEDKNTQQKQQQQEQEQLNDEVDVDVTQLSNSLARTPPRDDTETNNAT